MERRSGGMGRGSGPWRSLAGKAKRHLCPDPASLADFASSPLVAVLQRVLDEALPPLEVDALATKLEQGDLLHPARQDAKVGALLEQAKHALRAVRRGGTDEVTRCGASRERPRERWAAVRRRRGGGAGARAGGGGRARCASLVAGVQQPKRSIIGRTSGSRKRSGAWRRVPRGLREGSERARGLFQARGAAGKRSGAWTPEMRARRSSERSEVTSAGRYRSGRLAYTTGSDVCAASLPTVPRRRAVESP